jgi:hypothetical protein
MTDEAAGGMPWSRLEGERLHGDGSGTLRTTPHYVKPDGPCGSGSELEAVRKAASPGTSSGVPACNARPMIPPTKRALDAGQGTGDKEAHSQAWRSSLDVHF